MRHSSANPHHVQTVLDRVPELLGQPDSASLVAMAGALILDADTVPSIEAATASLVEVGMFSARQFEVMLGLVDSTASRYTLIPDVIDRACAYGCASRAAVGFVAALANLAREGDAVSLAVSITTARTALGDSDIALAASAFIASVTEQIALLAGLDAVDVHEELRGCVGVSQEMLEADSTASTPGIGDGGVRRSARSTRSACARRHHVLEAVGPH